MIEEPGWIMRQTSVLGEMVGMHGALYRTGVAGANQEGDFDRVLIFLTRYAPLAVGLNE